MINTKEDLDKLYVMEEELSKRATHVASFFRKIDRDFVGAENKVWYLYPDSDYPNEEYVVCCDYEDTFYGETDHCYVSFEPKWLFATDEELQKYVNDVLEERERGKKT